MSSEISNLSYTDKDFGAVYEELLTLAKQISYKWDPTASNESDPGVVLLKLAAICADKNNYNIDKNVLECFPLSVTQERVARQLFSELGYYMHGYQSPHGYVTICWTDTENGSYEVSNTTQYKIYTIPRFTMVADSSSNVVYTLIDEKDVKGDGTAQSFRAIQGTIAEYSINGDTTITTAHLDKNNRIYFTETNVAENGIYITMADGSSPINAFTPTSVDTMYGGWKRVDNLATQELGYPVYKFGVLPSSDTYYIEFPEDIDSLIGSGLNIKYIKTDGTDGNIGAREISKFFQDTTVTAYGDTTETVTLTTDNTTVFNPLSISNGANPETIDEAYQSYVRTVGTFETLVTLRDYANRIIEVGQDLGDISNCVVTDRTSDIQASYYIINSDDNMTKRDLVVTEAGTVPLMNAFDLKVYALGYAPTTDAPKTYLKTFQMLKNRADAVSNEITETLSLIADEKCVQHDYAPLLDDKLCLFVNKYPLKCRIIPQYKVTETQATEIKSNILTALYNTLNAKVINFGEEIDYDAIYKTIMNADKRIKSVVLDDLVYTTYAIYYSSTDNEYKEAQISEIGSWVAVASLPATGDTSKVYYNYTDHKTYVYNGTTYVQSLIHQFEGEIYAKSVLNGNTQFFVFDGGYNYALNQKMTANVEGIEKVTTETILTQTNGSTLKVQYYLTSNIVADTSRALAVGEQITIFWKDPESTIYQWKTLASTSSDTVTVQTNFALSSGTSDGYVVSDFSATSGWLSASKTITISGTSQNYTTYLDNASTPVSRAVTDTICTVSASGTLTPVYETTYMDFVMRDNESIYLYAPTYSASVSYSNYIKFQYQIDADISANSVHALTTNESVIFFWRETDDSDAPFHYQKYGAGTIIKPSFNISITKNSPNSEYPIGSLTTDSGVLSSSIMVTPSGSSTSISWETFVKSKLSSSNILSGTKTIEKLEAITGTYTSGALFYWITNKETLDSDGDLSYVLFNAGETTHILQNNEVLIRTNADQSVVETLGVGTQIERNWSTGAVTCKKYDGASEAVVEGTMDVSKFVKLTGTQTITATEMTYYYINAGATLRIGNVVSGETITFRNNAQTHTSLLGKTLSYKENAVADWVDIDTVSVGTTGYQGYSILNFVVSNTVPMQLLSGQTVAYKLYSTTSYVTISSPNFILTDYAYDMDGGADIDVTRITLENETIYMKLYAYEENTITGTSSVVPTIEDGVITLTMSFGSPSVVTFSGIQFKLPIGNYLCKLTYPTQISGVKLSIDGGSTFLTPPYPSGTNALVSGQVFNLPITGTGELTLTVTATPRETGTFVVTLGRPVGYTVPLDDDSAEAIKELIHYYNKDNLYEYLYEVDTDEEIEEPLLPLNFFNTNHICNKFTIGEMKVNTELEKKNIDIVVLNQTKG